MKPKVPKPTPVKATPRRRKTDHLAGWLIQYWYVLAAIVFSIGGLVTTWTVHIADTESHLDQIQNAYIQQIQRIDQRQQLNIEAHRSLTGELASVRQSNQDLREELKQLREEIRELRRVIDQLQQRNRASLMQTQPQ